MVKYIVKKSSSVLCTRLISKIQYIRRHYPELETDKRYPVILMLDQVLFNIFLRLFFRWKKNVFYFNCIIVSGVHQWKNYILWKRIIYFCYELGSKSCKNGKYWINLVEVHTKYLQHMLELTSCYHGISVNCVKIVFDLRRKKVSGGLSFSIVEIVDRSNKYFP